MPRARTVWVAFVALLAVSACAADRTTARPKTNAPTANSPATALRTIPAEVERVVDGDTAWFTLAAGRREKVRFIGVDTPESTSQHEPYGKEASDFTSAVLTAGRRVDLEVDVDERDRYGRLLAYVWLSPPADGSANEARIGMLNAILVEQGYATILTVPPNVAYVDLFLALQLEARRAARGLWATGA